ncbi:hypothetical protein PWY87_32275 [Kribbella solani]|uniref:hypothetical protein n=1 Tax=Kribbella solani TaxID=236067 RepID=UPI0029ACD96A|nr:hypothetical protein [Kribbella solani]MDX3006398.1 hypothetical protein [Kribbella solani]
MTLEPTEAGGWDALSRRRLLQLTGAGAGAMALGSLTAGTASAEEAGTADRAGRPRPELLNGSTFPVGLWVPPPAEQTTLARYREVTDAGFTFATSVEQPQTVEFQRQVLRLAEQAGLKWIATDERLINIYNQQPPEQWGRVVESVVADYRRYPAWAGFYLWDEPNAGVFTNIGKVAARIRRAAPTKLPYVNLFPTYANARQLGAPTYEAYLDRYVDEANPEYMSYDHYSVLKPDGVTPDFFINLAAVRNKSLATGLPTWAFILSCEHNRYRLPSEADLYWQINVNLAYGAKGIQYFTYWTPKYDEYIEALISKAGERTPLYYWAQKINCTHLATIGAELLPLVSETVTHANEPNLPAGAAGFTADAWTAGAQGSAVIVSRFRAGHGNQPHRWLLVTNGSSSATATSSLTLGAGVRADEFRPTSREYTPVRTSGGVLPVQLAPGMARLFRLTKSH